MVINNLHRLEGEFQELEGQTSVNFKNLKDKPLFSRNTERDQRQRDEDRKQHVRIHLHLYVFCKVIQ